LIEIRFWVWVSRGKKKKRNKRLGTLVKMRPTNLGSKLIKKLLFKKEAEHGVFRKKTEKNVFSILKR
jgi:hypothetical protein